MTTAPSFNMPEHERRAIVQPAILRPAQMLARYGMRHTRICGNCLHFFATARGAGRCRLSLQGNPEALGYAWRATWRACGAFTVAREPIRPDTAASGQTPTAYVQQELL